MIAPFGALVRGLALLGVFACALAIGVARLVPQSSGFRLWCTSHHAAFNGGFFAPAHLTTEVLNTETGQLSSLRLPEGDALQWAAFSDWIEEDGESVVVGRWTSFSGRGGDRSCEAVGIARFSFPSGRPLDRVKMEHHPASTPCWYPDNAGRVLFAAADGLLYHYTFSETGNGPGSVKAESAQRIAWQHPPANVERIWIQEPSWPDDRRLGGCLFAVVGYRIPGTDRHTTMPYRVWWMRLNVAGTAIVDAGRLAVDEVPGESGRAEDVDERYPALVPTRGGDPTLVYFVQPRNHNRGEVRAAAIEFNPRTHAPFIRHATSEKLVSAVLPTPPAFTPSGDGLFALVGNADGSVTFEHVDFPGPHSAHTSNAIARRPGESRGALDANPG